MKGRLSRSTSKVQPILKSNKTGKKKAADANKENDTTLVEKVIEVPVTPQKKAPVSQSASATKPRGGNSPFFKKVVSHDTPKVVDDFCVNPTSLFEPTNRVKKVYKIVQKSTGALGGNGYDGAIYGELTMHSMQKVIEFMVSKCNMTSESRFIDVGSGLGKPNFHACQDPGVRLSIGIELEEIRWQLAIQNLKAALRETQDDGAAVSGTEDGSGSERDLKLLPGVNFIHGDVFDVITTDPFTHIYMYDLGFPPPLQKKNSRIF